MSSDIIASKDDLAPQIDHVAGPKRPSRWRRFWNELAALDGALSFSYDELQDRRIAALEKEVAQLRMQMAAQKSFDARSALPEGHRRRASQ